MSAEGVKMSFRVGDTVRLKSGGPVMTVSKPGRLTVGGVPVGSEEPGKVFCKWFNEEMDKPKGRFFDQEELELCEPEEEQKGDIGYI